MLRRIRNNRFFNYILNDKYSFKIFSLRFVYQILIYENLNNKTTKKHKNKNK